jgi:hypothetical protein
MLYVGFAVSWSSGKKKLTVGQVVENLACLKK